MGVATQPAFGQSLSAGDVAFTGFNADADDDFSIVALTDIPADTTIFFTDEEWDGSSFGTGEDDLVWNTGGSIIAEGSVIVFNNIDANGSITVSAGSIDQGSINLAGSNEVLFAYTSTDGGTRNVDTFLGAISNSTEQYNGPDGTLNNTGLTQDTTAILLSDNIDGAKYIGDRSGNTPNGYRNELNDIANNWNETDDDGNILLPFDDTPFTLVSPPTVAFTASSIDSSENSGPAKLTVKLVESTGTEVKADIVFKEEASSASSSDIGSFPSTVTFSGLEGDGETTEIEIPLNDDSNFEGTEKAVFQLQNVRESLAIGGSPGTAISPNVLTLNITDDDAPDIVINEILYDPAGDANGDGVTDTGDDEFVEFVNNSDRDVDISSWMLSDGLNGGTVRYTFPEGTVIPAGTAFVVFSASAEGENFGGASLFSPEGTLSLNNGGDDVILEDENGNEITSVTYSGSESDESITRNTDITGNFEGHTSADTDDSSPFSPGTQIDGTPFSGSDHAIAIRGSEGWRLMASPVQSATFNDLFGDLWMQGVNGSDDPGGPGTLLSWTESDGGSFSAPGDMGDPMTPGKGYVVYVFEDDEFSTSGIQGGFPKTINSDGNENTGTVSVLVTSNDADDANGIDGNEGWNLLGNPFDTDITASAIVTALENVGNNSGNVNTNLKVWDHTANNGNGSYINVSGSETIAPFQAFFAKYEVDGVSGDVDLTKSALEANQGADFYKNVAEDAFTFDLSLHGEQYYDTYTVEFNDKGTTELDRYDAYKLFSLNASSINFYSTLGNNRLQKNVLPRDLESNLEIPLSFQANGRTSLTLRWNKVEEIPNDWDVTLLDKETNEEIDLRTSNEYQFNVVKQQEQKFSSQEKSLLNKATSSDDDSDSRFVLSVKPNGDQSNSGEMPNTATLNPNYPNPFNPTTTLSYEVSQDAQVTLTVWNMIGQKVATLVDGMVEAGEHQETWNAANMPSGIYIARFEVGSEVFTRKMTLIK